MRRTRVTPQWRLFDTSIFDHFIFGLLFPKYTWKLFHNFQSHLVNQKSQRSFPSRRLFFPAEGFPSIYAAVLRTLINGENVKNIACNILSETLFEFLRLVLWIRLKLCFFAYLRDEKCFAFSTQYGGTNENHSFTALRAPHYFSAKTPTQGSFTPILLFQTYDISQTIQNTIFYFF